MDLKIIETHIAAKQDQPQRIQEYGVGVFKSLPTKSSLKKAIKKELVLIDGKVASTGWFIKGGERIELMEAPKKPGLKRLNLSLEVVFEDEYLAVINKPAGILVSGNSFKTVANALEQNLSTSHEPDATSPKPVHRLDYPTTGLLVVGKTSSSLVRLGNLFEEKKVVKTYYAITIGKMSNKGIIRTAIDDKEAHTDYEVLKTVASPRFEYLNLVKLNPKTGRRHQLRKHLYMMGNPILGDATYHLPGLLLKGKGLYLHAGAIEFVHPFSEKTTIIRKEVPEKFRKIFGNAVAV